MKTLKQQLLSAGLGLTDADFGTHESDLYVLDIPGVREWLAGTKWNFTSFVGAKDSDWAGKRALDIPFGN